MAACTKEEKEKLKNLIATIPEKDLRRLLLEAAKKDVRLRETLLLKYSASEADSVLADLYRVMDAYVGAASKKRLFMKWDRDICVRDCYTDTLVDMMTEETRKLVKGKRRTEAFCAVLVCSTKVSETPFQDQHIKRDITERLVELAEKLWKKSLKKEKEMEKTLACDAVKSVSKSSDLGKALAEFLTFSVKEPAFVEQDLRNKQKQLESIRKHPEALAACSLRKIYSYENLYEDCLDHMQTLGWGEEAREAFCADFAFLPGPLEDAINAAEEAGDDEKLLADLERAAYLIRKSQAFMQRNVYVEKRFSLLMQQGKREDARDFLFDMVVSGIGRGDTWYEKLLDFYQGEDFWKVVKASSKAEFLLGQEEKIASEHHKDALKLLEACFLEAMDKGDTLKAVMILRGMGKFQDGDKASKALLKKAKKMFPKEKSFFKDL